MYRRFLARKYLFSRMITFAALVVVAASVAVLIVIVSIMEGFRSELQTRIRGTSSDLKVESTRYIGLRDPDAVADLVAKVPGVEGAAPYVETLVLYRSTAPFGGDELKHRFLRVVDLERRLPSEELAQYIKAAGFSTIPADPKVLLSRTWLETTVARIRKGYGSEPIEAKDLPPPILVGSEAFVTEFLRVGDLVHLTAYSPRTQAARTARFTVAGYFKTGLYEVDSMGMVLERGAARDFLGLVLPDGHDVASGVQIDVAPAFDSDEGLDDVRSRVESALEAAETPFVRVLTWRDEKAPLLGAVQIEKFLMSVILGVMILFSGLMMFIVLTLLVVEKTRDLGVLQSIGATRLGIEEVFFRIGLALAASGMVIGSIYGVGFAACVNTIQRWIKLLTGLEVFRSDVYYLDRIPVRFKPFDLILIIAVTVVVSFLAMLVPAWRASRKDPVAALRYE